MIEEQGRDRLRHSGALIPAAPIAVLANSVTRVADWVLNRTISLKGAQLMARSR